VSRKSHALRLAYSVLEAGYIPEYDRQRYAVNLAKHHDKKTGLTYVSVDVRYTLYGHHYTESLHGWRVMGHDHGS
jgi:hypothetical protein